LFTGTSVHDASTVLVIARCSTTFSPLLGILGSFGCVFELDSSGLFLASALFKSCFSGGQNWERDFVIIHSGLDDQRIPPLMFLKSFSPLLVHFHGLSCNLVFLLFLGFTASHMLSSSTTTTPVPLMTLEGHLSCEMPQLLQESSSADVERESNRGMRTYAAQLPSSSGFHILRELQIHISHTCMLLPADSCKPSHIGS
jgi:hypothetical protein